MIENLFEIFDLYRVNTENEIKYERLSKRCAYPRFFYRQINYFYELIIKESIDNG